MVFILKKKDNMLKDLKTLEAWFVTGSQHLYGEKTLRQVDLDSREIVSALDQSSEIPVKIVFKPVLTTAEAILALCREANNAEHCIGLITWMHTRMVAGMLIRLPKLLHRKFSRAENE